MPKTHCASDHRDRAGLNHPPPGLESCGSWRFGLGGSEALRFLKRKCSANKCWVGEHMHSFRNACHRASDFSAIDCCSGWVSRQSFCAKPSGSTRLFPPTHFVTGPMHFAVVRVCDGRLVPLKIRGNSMIWKRGYRFPADVKPWQRSGVWLEASTGVGRSRMNMHGRKRDHRAGASGR